MTDDIAISVRNLGKRYKRRTGLKHNSVRDLLQDSVSNMLRTFGRPAPQKDYFWALSNASFDIKKGENVGIIGLNGAGKSTLLKVLSRIVTPTTGEARLHGRLGALLEVGTGFHEELTGRENMYLYGSILGMTRKEVDEKYEAIVDFAEIRDSIDVPVKRYSSGMYVRLAFAVAAHLDPDILMLDEVLSVGDITFQRKCMNFARSLEKRGSTILFVSHNMFAIKTMCQRVIYLRKGQVIYDGPTEEGLALYEKDSRLGDVAWFQDDDRNSAITITDVEILKTDGSATTVFDHGEPMKLRIKYKAFRQVDRPDFRVGIDRGDEVHCCTYSSIDDGADMPFVKGEGLVELNTPPLKLVSDLYSVNVIVRERGHGRTLCAQIGGHIHVRHPEFATSGYGVFHEQAQWKVRTGAEAEQSGVAPFSKPAGIAANG